MTSIIRYERPPTPRWPRSGDTGSVDHVGFIVATSSGGRYANTAVLLILGLFTLFMSFAVVRRSSLTFEPESESNVDADVDFHDDEHLESQLREGEHWRAAITPRLTTSLRVVGVALVVAAGVAALVTLL
ncbi:MAG TPA: hypothetical protein VIJ86_04735 [Acidimicrobiales bacterium]